MVTFRIYVTSFKFQFVIISFSDSMIQTKLQQNDVNSRCDEKAEKRGAWPLEGGHS